MPKPINIFLIIGVLIILASLYYLVTMPTGSDTEGVFSSTSPYRMLWGWLGIFFGSFIVYVGVRKR